MDLANKIGQTKLSILVTGSRIWLTAKENSIMQMAICMMESGFVTKHMASVHIFTVMELHMRVTGKMIFNMGLVLKNGQTKVAMKGTI